MEAWDVAKQIIGAILALALVLFLAWVVLKWLNNRLPGLSGGAQRSIKVLDRLTVGKNSSVLLIQVKNSVMLVAINEHAVQKLAEFDAAEGGFELPEAATPPSFTAALRDAALKMRKGRKDEGEDE